MSRSAHVDTFARDPLPPHEQWPELLFELPELQFPERLNCAHALLDRWVEQGQGRTAYLWTCRACNYRFEAVAIFDESQSEPAPLAA